MTGTNQEQFAFINISIDGELYPEHVKSVLATFANKDNVQNINSKRIIDVRISTEVDINNPSLFQICLGNKSFDIEKSKNGIIFYLDYAEVSQYFPHIFDLIHEKVNQDLRTYFFDLCEESLKKFKFSKTTDQTDKIINFEKKIKEIIIQDKQFNDLKKMINDLDESKELGIQVVDIYDAGAMDPQMILPIVLDSESKYSYGLALKNKECDKSLVQIAKLLQEHFEVALAIRQKISEFGVWEAAIEAIDVGLVVLDGDHNIRLYNHNFIDMNLALKNLEKLSDGEFLKMADENFQIAISDIELDEQNYKVYIFQKISDHLDTGSNVNNEELGIICSSLAHELNNPIAGILASLTVIEMDDENGELKVQLEDMKKGVQRCKQLVETFLGFSKSQKMECMNRQQNGFGPGMDQAMELIRFRMVESNLSIQINLEKDDEFSNNLDFSLMVMMNYLLLGELLTSLSHFNLLTNQKLKSIYLNIKESSDAIWMQWEPGFSLSSEFISSRLFLHLLETLELEIKFEDSSITLQKIVINDFVESAHL